MNRKTSAAVFMVYLLAGCSLGQVMSYRGGIVCAMTTMKITGRMEPELEAIARDLHSEERRAMAEKLERWAHQLRVSARPLPVPRTPQHRRADTRRN